MSLNSGYEFWKGSLKASKMVLAPMVDQSELAWRMLSRRHGAELCYTPMLHASIFVKDARYRRENLVTCEEDRPLIVQFCANDPDTFLEACRLAAPICDAVDLNLGCPQAIARKGHYGAYLQDEWELIEKMVKIVHSNVNVPICCKIRIFEDIDKSVRYAQMLEVAGCQLLAVHGRIREQKGPLTGTASWVHIKAIKENVGIPVIANGNIQYFHDVDRCLKEIGCDGVMIAEGSLHNPALFEGTSPPVWEMALEYLDLVERYPCPTSYIRGHLFKMFHHCLNLPDFKDLQEELAKAGTLEIFKSVTLKLRERFKDAEGNVPNSQQEMPFQLPLPVYICQPYVRPTSSLDSGKESTRENKMRSGENQLDSVTLKRNLQDGSDSRISKRRLKKLKRNPHKKFEKKSKEDYAICEQCCNPKGTKCSYGLCKACCKVLCYKDCQDCPGHRFLFKTKRTLKNTVLTGKCVTKVVPEVS